jgi:hypothetical protein
LNAGIGLLGRHPRDSGIEREVSSTFLHVGFVTLGWTSVIRWIGEGAFHEVTVQIKRASEDFRVGIGISPKNRGH